MRTYPHLDIESIIVASIHTEYEKSKTVSAKMVESLATIMAANDNRAKLNATYQDQEQDF